MFFFEELKKQKEIINKVYEDNINKKEQKDCERIMEDDNLRKIWN